MHIGAQGDGDGHHGIKTQNLFLLSFLGNPEPTGNRTRQCPHIITFHDYQGLLRAHLLPTQHEYTFILYFVSHKHPLHDIPSQVLKIRYLPIHVQNFQLATGKDPKPQSTREIHREIDPKFFHNTGKDI